jgi:hypothetical protein
MIILDDDCWKVFEPGFVSSVFNVKKDGKGYGNGYGDGNGEGNETDGDIIVMQGNPMGYGMGDADGQGDGSGYGDSGRQDDY